MLRHNFDILTILPANGEKKEEEKIDEEEDNNKDSDKGTQHKLQKHRDSVAYNNM